VISFALHGIFLTFLFVFCFFNEWGWPFLFFVLLWLSRWGVQFANPLTAPCLMLPFTCFGFALSEMKPSGFFLWPVFPFFHTFLFSFHRLGTLVSPREATSLLPPPPSSCLGLSRFGIFRHRLVHSSTLPPPFPSFSRPKPHTRLFCPLCSAEKEGLSGSSVR